MRPLTPEKRRALRALLKAAYDAVLAEDHSAFHDQVRRLQ
jgi:hypothetical protein